MFCGKCGNKNQENALFCVSCGNAFSQNTINQEQAIQPQQPIEVFPEPVVQPQQPIEQFSQSQVQPQQPVEVFPEPVVQPQQPMPQPDLMAAPQPMIQQPAQQPIEQFQQPIEQPVYQQPLNNQVPNNNSNMKMYLLGGGIGIGILIVLFFIIGILSSDQIYFDSDSYDSGSRKPNSREKTGSYKTVIVHDRTYNDIAISSTNDANKIIAEDSTKQKSKCPKDIVEIENRIINNYNIAAVNLCEVDKSFALEIEDVVKTVYNEFPSARGHLTNMTLANVPMSDSYVAAFMPIFPFASTKSQDKWAIKTQFLFNTSYFLNLQKMDAATRDASTSGHFPPNTNKQSVVAHEYGHYLSFLAMMRSHGLTSALIIDSNNEDILYKVADDFSEGIFSLKIITEAYNNHKAKANTTMSLLEFRSSISGYAVAKDNNGNYIYDETIAEAFHDYYLNGQKSKAASREIVAVLKKYLGGS